MNLNSDKMRAALAALYRAAGCDVSDRNVRKHRKFYTEIGEKIDRVLRKAVCMQMRGTMLGRNMRYSDFHRFEVVETLIPSLSREPGCAGAAEDGHESSQAAGEPGDKANAEEPENCPLCGTAMPGRLLENHIKEELLGQSKDGETRVLIDGAFGVAQKEISIRSENARELKKKIFSELGISVSKQDLFLGGLLLGNKDKTGNAVVDLRLKKRYE